MFLKYLNFCSTLALLLHQNLTFCGTKMCIHFGILVTNNVTNNRKCKHMYQVLTLKLNIYVFVWEKKITLVSIYVFTF